MKTTVYVAVAALAAAAGFGVYRFGFKAEAPVPQPAPVAQTESAPQASDAAAGSANEEPAIPATLPDFTLMDRDGSMRSIRSWPGKSMVVNFWATWCAPCRKEIPLLKELQSAHGKDGVQVVGVAVDVREDVLAFAKEMSIDYPLLMGEKEGLDAVTQFGIGSIGFPFTVFTDNQARIVAYHLGELTKPQSAVLFDVVARVNRGELTPEAARTVAARELEGLKPAG
jgi:thiol-disulfide isomerase/thioredoxin